MKNIVILYVSLILLFPFVYAHAVPGNAELVLENIQIEPPFPKKGELITITGNVYNTGIVETDSLASIITAAYFVDEKLLYIDEIGNIGIGIQNGIKISSIPIWNVEPGNHVIKIIIDYHDTLNDQYDSLEGNIIEKSIFIEYLDSVNILLDVSPSYAIQNKETLLKITVSLEDSNSNRFLNDKKIILSFNEEEIQLITDQNGKISYSTTIDSFNDLKVTAYFEGNEQYSPSSESLSIYSIPKEVTSAVIMKIIDVEKQYNFEDYLFEFLIFQDSYENLIKKITPGTTLLNLDTFWISLPPEHDYFAEIYLDGRFLFVTDKKQLIENSIIVEEFVIPEPAEIRFRVINEIGEPQSNVLVNNWIYSTISDKNGLTEWIKVIPNVNDVPYVAELILPDQRTVTSIPFLIFSGEKKTIDIIIKEITGKLKIPNWIKNNASWWADDQIDDRSFIEAIEYLIKEDILKISSTTQVTDSNSNEIPNWIKNNASWWADDQIDDTSFVKTIQYLVKEGIIQIR